MAINQTFQVVLIGSGRLARSLGHALKDACHCVTQVYSPTLSHAKDLALEIDAMSYTNTISDIIRNANCYIIAIKDDAIVDVVKQLDVGNSLVVHTSGSTSIDIFKGYVKNYGVFYPFQTFTNRIVPLNDVPIFIESPFKDSLSLLKNLGECVSEKVSVLSSENRLKLHTSAVFACNFTNHMLVLANKILQSADLDFSILQHLVNETVSNAFTTNNPLSTQTGPASRNDRAIITKHIEQLAPYPELQAIYQQLTNSILSQNNE